MSNAPTAPGTRVSTLELFFDLVFVFTITQVTHLVTHAHGATDLIRAFLVLGVTWWMYQGYCWLTNNVSTERTSMRLFILVAMAGFLVMAIATPHIADRDGIAFGIAYLAIIIVHTALFTHAPNASARRIWSVVPFNITGALLIIAAGIAPARWNLALWIAALLALVSVALMRVERGFSLRAGHFAERHGLVILIALGESVAGLGAGAAEIPVRLPLVSAAVLGLALAAALWWSYFAHDDVSAEQVMTSADDQERVRLGVEVYWFAHLIMIAGIVGAAAGLEGVVSGILHPESSAVAWRLGAGVAVYLAGEALFRRRLRIGPAVGRVVTGVLAAATVPIGLAVSPLVQLAVIVMLLTVMLVVEGRGGRVVTSTRSTT